MIEPYARGRRQEFELRLLADEGSYPRVSFRADDALYVTSSNLVYTVVRAEEPNEFGFSEIGWAELGELRLWGALALAIPEGRGFCSFYPLRRGTLCSVDLEPRYARRLAERLAKDEPDQSHSLHWFEPSLSEVTALYDALKRADSVLLRGVSCYLRLIRFRGHVRKERYDAHYGWSPTSTTGLHG